MRTRGDGSASTPMAILAKIASNKVDVALSSFFCCVAVQNESIDYFSILLRGFVPGKISLYLSSNLIISALNFHYRYTIYSHATSSFPHNHSSI